MKHLALFVALVVVMFVPPGVGAQPAPAPPLPCTPAGPVKFVCGQAGPEDLVEVPGTRWLLASAYGPEGGIFLIDTRAASSRALFPDATAKDRHDRKTYESCPGPPVGAERERFRTHGLYLQPGRGSQHTLYVVHHGARESIEVFELDARAQPSLTWIGCVVAPATVGLNSVAALPGGGFVATNFDPLPAPGEKRAGPFTAALLEGRNNGELWEWHAGKGWSKVPGSESAGANGVVLSPDGKWFYVAQWGNRSFYRLSRGKEQISRQEIALGFRVDNVRWAPDGTLLVAGQGETTSVVGKVDPVAMTYRTIIDYPTSNAISAATVAVQVGNEFWTGTFRGDRLAIYPAAGIPAAPGAARQGAPGAALTPPVFHHLHFNSTDPAAAIAGYLTLWPTTTAKTTFAGIPGIKNGTLFLLFDKVAAPAPTQPQSPYWHQVWLTPDVRAYVARARAAGMNPEPLYTSDAGDHVDISSDTLPGTLTKAALAEARAKGVQPTHQAGFTYITGPDRLSVEGFERAGETERLGQIDMWQDDPICAELWYEKHLLATRRGGRGDAPPVTEATCRTPVGEPSWPSTMQQGTRRTPSGRAAFADVALFWYTRPGSQPLATTRGQVVDHLAFSVRNLDGWMAKLKGENVKILREPYRLGDTRAALIEGPSREAIELVEER